MKKMRRDHQWIHDFNKFLEDKKQMEQNYRIYSSGYLQRKQKLI